MRSATLIMLLFFLDVAHVVVRAHGIDIKLPDGQFGSVLALLLTVGFISALVRDLRDAFGEKR